VFPPFDRSFLLFTFSLLFSLLPLFLSCSADKPSLTIRETSGPLSVPDLLLPSSSLLSRGTVYLAPSSATSGRRGARNFFRGNFFFFFSGDSVSFLPPTVTHIIHPNNLFFFPFPFSSILSFFLYITKITRDNFPQWSHSFPRKYYYLPQRTALDNFSSFFLELRE
jgi:hypothetical protein